MFLLAAVIVLLYLFYQWVMQKYEYFEAKGVPFSKPVFLLGSSYNMFFNRLSLPDVTLKWYREMRSEK
jgi:hypothetical protein